MAKKNQVANRINDIWEDEFNLLFESFKKELDEPRADNGWTAVPELAMPINAQTGRFYSGINAVNLDRHLLNNLHESGEWDNRFIGFNQAKNIGLKMRKGSKGVKVLLYKTHKEVKDKDGTKTLEKLEKPYRSYQTVFHMSCFTNAPPMPTLEDLNLNNKPFEKDSAIETFIKKSTEKMNVEVIFSHCDSAHYSPKNHAIQMPLPALFRSKSAFYGVTLHEMGHATAHKSCMNRDVKPKQGETKDQAYAREELVAEFTSYMLGKKLFRDIDHKLDAHYLSSYLKDCQAPKQDFVDSLFQAERCSNFIIESSGMKPEIEAYKTQIETKCKDVFSHSLERFLEKSKSVEKQQSEQPSLSF
ncbi:zincin-like metallopeptidase domain-containing protein [Aliivibrio fischeri]|uniref:DNA primase TraC, putative n=1 Tax=Aliivibrio fischeri (strain MJ11) TaxID=388396 RepID=B5EW86_ALIFM|nr:zincin-like metallopeptidase domain-containing protein [Aliivibrio fischeri]ACH64667.1 DNA primase TraC, putative [Aliivibrio fischeri MJ11]MUK37590.1 DUF1738 domain-containing protein [Aliivibrio fischeri]